jgi:bacterioferritin-associated ferredoxin
VYICSCRLVNDRVVRAAIAIGAATVDELSMACDVAMRCGGCVPELERLLAAESALGQTEAHHAA